MRLSYKDIDRIALSAHNKFMGALTNNVQWVKAINIENFAIYHLGLDIEYTRLCDYNKTMGITTYCDTRIELTQYLRDTTINVPKNKLLLNDNLEPPMMYGKADPELNRRRFTIAHESAHQIIYRILPDSERKEFDRKYSACTISIDEFNNIMNWHEWQANALAASLLMPKKFIELLMGNRRIYIYGKRMNRPDKLLIANMSNKLKVSRTALALRLKQLGFATVLPTDAYFDPTDIIKDEDDYENYEAGVKADVG